MDSHTQTWPAPRWQEHSPPQSAGLWGQQGHCVLPLRTWPANHTPSQSLCPGFPTSRWRPRRLFTNAASFHFKDHGGPAEPSGLQDEAGGAEEHWGLQQGCGSPVPGTAQGWSAPSEPGSLPRPALSSTTPAAPVIVVSRRWSRCQQLVVLLRKKEKRTEAA